MAVNLLPLAIAALVAGSGAQWYGQRRQNQAMASAMDQHARRAERRSAEAQSLFERTLGEQGIETQQQMIDDAARDKVGRVSDLTEREAAFVDPLLPGQDRAPKVVREQASRDLADQLARARAQIGALARLEGFSTRAFDRGLQLDRVRPEFGNIGLFARGDRNILDADMHAAQFRGGNARLLGDLLTSVGGAMLMGGLGSTGLSNAGVERVISSGQRVSNPLLRSGAFLA